MVFQVLQFLPYSVKYYNSTESVVARNVNFVIVSEFRMLKQATSVYSIVIYSKKVQ